MALSLSTDKCISNVIVVDEKCVSFNQYDMAYYIQRGSFVLNRKLLSSVPEFTLLIWLLSTVVYLKILYSLLNCQQDKKGLNLPRLTHAQ